MNKMKIVAIMLISAMILFAQGSKNGNDYLAFAQGDNDFSLGFLAGWGQGEGLGLPLVWDHGAFGGMFSFGAELRMWWVSYSRYNGNWWNNTWYNGHNLIQRPVYGEPNSQWYYDDYGYWSGGVWHSVWRWDGHQYWLVDNSGNPYNPASKKFTKFGWAPMFRFMFHPFGMPVLKGQVKVANVLDPYVGLKFGFSVINWDKDDPFKQDDYHRDADFPVFNPVTGIRWYFKDNIALWSEVSIYDFSFGINFKF